MAEQTKKTFPHYEQISARVEVSARKNCEQIASAMKWSFNQTVNEAMKRLKLEDILKAIKNPE